MSDTPANPESNGADQHAPSLRVMAQYLKDLSFESPRAPEIFRQGAEQPNIEVNVDVGARGFGQNQFEVELSVSAKATSSDGAVFVVETAYAGAFEVANVPQDQIEPILLVECPRILFPFVRQIVSDTTQSGNFPPVWLDPIDFFAIYQQRRIQASAGDGGQTAHA